MLRALLVGGPTDTCQRLSVILKVRWRDLQLDHMVDPSQALHTIARNEVGLLFVCPDASLPQWADFLAEARGATEALLILIGGDSSATDRIWAFELGADDWLSLTELPMEFIAKVNTILRRAHRLHGACWTCGPLRIHQGTHRVDLAGRRVRLSPREYRILSHLAQRSPTPVSPDELLAVAWGNGYEGDTELLRKSIRRLRQKLADEPAELILNQRGEGYMLAASCSPGGEH